MKNIWKMPGCYIQARKKGGVVVAYQSTYFKFGVRLSCDSHPTLAEARNFLIECAERFKHVGTRAKALKEVEEHNPAPPGYDIMRESLAEVVELFCKSIQSTKTHRNQKSGALKVLGRVGEVKIGQMKPSFIAKFVGAGRQTNTNRKEPYALTTLCIHLMLFSKAIKWRAKMMDCVGPAFHVEDQYFVDQARSEGLDVDKDSWRNERTRRLEEDEEELLMDGLAELDEPCPRQWQLLFQFALATGSRQVELVDAKWSDFSPAAKTWKVGKHKTKARRHTLSERAREVLVELQALRDPDNPRVFHTLPSAQKVSLKFNKLIRRLGLPDLVFRDSRHEGITRIVADSAEDITVLMRWVGHSNPKMNERYTHMREDEIERRVMKRAQRQLSASAREMAPAPIFASPWAFGAAPSITWSFAAKPHFAPASSEGGALA